MNNPVQSYTERLFAVTTSVYLLLIAVLPVSQNTLTKYRLTDAQARLVSLAVIVPYLIIWYIAVFGYTSLITYARKIQRHADGKAFATLSAGVLLLALWLPLSALTGTVLNAVQVIHPMLIPLTVYVNNFLNIVFLLVTFIILARGSKQLLRIITAHELAMPTIVLAIFVSFSALYTYLVLSDPARLAPTVQIPIATYYLPDWLIVLTVIIPRLITWYIGIRATYNLYAYQKRVAGRIYRRSVYNLAVGLLWVSVTIMVLRCFQSLAVLFSGRSLAVIILIIYALLAVISIGYILIALGARRLLRIEQV